MGELEAMASQLEAGSADAAAAAAQLRAAAGHISAMSSQIRKLVRALQVVHVVVTQTGVPSLSRSDADEDGTCGEEERPGQSFPFVRRRSGEEGTRSFMIKRGDVHEPEEKSDE